MSTTQKQDRIPRLTRPLFWALFASICAFGAGIMAAAHMMQAGPSLQGYQIQWGIMLTLVALMGALAAVCAINIIVPWSRSRRRRHA